VRVFCIPAVTLADALHKAAALHGPLTSNYSVSLLNNGRWLITCGRE
jgi:hypothetical protein